MITIFDGLHGSGKTSMLALTAWVWWCQGYDIYTNFPNNFEQVFNFQADKRNLKIKERGKFYSFRTMLDLTDVRGGVVLVDEIQGLMNSRTWDKLPQEVQWKLQIHRHHIKVVNGKVMDLHIFGTSQAFYRVDIVLRELTHEVHRFKRLAVFPFGLLLMRRYFDLNILGPDLLKPPEYVGKLRFSFVPMWLLNSLNTYSDMKLIKN